MAKSSTKSGTLQVVLLLVLLIIVIIATIYWFNYIGLLNIQRTVFKLYQKFPSLKVSKEITDPFLIEKEFLEKFKISLENKALDLKKLQTDLNKKELELNNKEVEIKKKEISYTIDTLQELKKIYLNDDLYLIIGYDNLLVFDKWKDPDEIFKLAKVIALRRISSFQEANHEYFKKAIIANAPIIQISSSEIRERIKNGKTIKFLVPDSVADYIKANKLYL